MIRGQLFFEIAVGLIPALLFGGAVSSAFKPGPWFENLRGAKRLLVQAAVAIAVGAVLYGEILAIEQALAPDASSWKTTYVVYVVVYGSAAMGVAFLRPWVGEFRSLRQGRTVALAAFVTAFSLAAIPLVDAIGDARAACIEERADQEFEAAIQAWEPLRDADRRAIELLFSRRDLSARERRPLLEAVQSEIRTAEQVLLFRLERWARRMNSDPYC